MKTYRLIVVCEQDPNDVKLVRENIAESAVESLLTYLPVLDGLIRPKKPSAFAAFISKKP